MFERFKRLWRGIRRMFDYMTLKNVIGRDIALSQDMINAVNRWRAMLDGEAEWIQGPVESLRIEAGICREFADAVLVEMESGITGSDKLDRAYQHCISGLNESLQEGLGLGAFVIKPLGTDDAEFVSADRFIPIKFTDTGEPLDIAFLSVKQVGGQDYYTRVERHYLAGGNLTIENTCYHSNSRGYIGSPCELYDVPEWENISPGPVTYVGMGQMDFGYYRNPLKNRVDGSECGVSIFESAQGRIAKADIQAARLDWEYDSGERAVHVDDRALKKKGSKVHMPHLNSRLYRGLNLEDGKDRELYKEYSPNIRDEAFIRGMEKHYREIEFIVGLAYGDLSDVQEVDKTATEIKVSKSRKYNRVTAIQKNLRSCLEGFAAGLAFYNGQYTSGYGFNCRFHDSILMDEETERQQDREDMALGIMQAYEYRMKWYGEDEETARRMIATKAEVIE